MIEALKHMGNPSVAMLVCWFLFLLISVFTYFKKQAYTAYFLFAAAICIAAAFALFAPYLYLWDEQFHALVGKNLGKHMLIPKLYENHLVDVNQNWLNGEIWLHKQPLFTWQIALSVKLLGANAFAVRLPSVLFHGALVLAVFRIGILVFNRKTGFIAALLVMHSSFLLGLISGRLGTDHNDYIFLCYITLSIWAWFEWNNSHKRKWLYWIGIFAGCAILTKWLVGLLVFAGWTFVILPKLKKANFWLQVKPLLISFSVCLLVAVPWQIYTFLRFPLEAKREMAYNSAHVFHPVENHSGSAWFHYEQLQHLYFNPMDFMILFSIGLVFLLLRKIKKEHKVYLLVSIGIVYLFFTLVQTKMPAFTAPVYGLVLLIVAFGITEITAWIAWRKVGKAVSILLLALVLNWMLKPSPTLSAYGFRTNEIANRERKHMMKSLHLIRYQGKSNGKRVVFGVDYFPFAHISWMFFNDEIAYPFIPTKEEKEKLEREGYQVLLVNNLK